MCRYYEDNFTKVIEITSTEVQDEGLYQCVVTIGEQTKTTTFSLSFSGKACYVQKHCKLIFKIWDLRKKSPYTLVWSNN